MIKNNNMCKIINRVAFLCLISLLLTSCSFDFLYSDDKNIEESIVETYEEANVESTDPILTREIFVDFTTPYATYSIINDGHSVLYYHNEKFFPATLNEARKVVAVNAGHGTKNGSIIKTFAHPDLSPKVAGGTTKEGSILASAISDGTVLLSGEREADVNLKIANAFKEKLLESGFDVLMIRDDDDTRLDNIARTVIANKNADCHISIHIDSTETDKGAFYVTPYNDEGYLSMEPLKSNRKNIKALGDAMIEAFKESDEKVWKDKGTLQGDLTQLSYSTNASIDIEVGDKATIFDEDKIDSIANALLLGVKKYFE